MQELNDEADKTIEASRSKRVNSRREFVETKPSSLDVFEDRYKSSIEDIKRRNELEKSSFDDLMQRLKTNTQQHLQQLEILHKNNAESSTKK